MPAVSKAQRGFAGMSSSPAGRAKLEAEGKKPMPVKVAEEFRQGSPKVERKSKKEGHMASEKGESKAERKREGEKGIRHLSPREEHHTSGKDRHGSPRLSHSSPERTTLLHEGRTNYHGGAHLEKKTGKANKFAGMSSKGDGSE